MRTPLPPRALTLALVLLAAGSAAASAPPAAMLDEDAARDAIVRIRQALPERWTITDIRWNTAPAGWAGDSTAVYLRLEDESVRFRNEDHGFDYRPFYKVWILPVAWEGRMSVSPIEPGAPHAQYLGETGDVRLLYRTLGRNTWEEGPDTIARALRLDAYPLSPAPRHTIDVGAMQELYRRLNSRPGMLERWQRQIYALEELPGMIYLEMLTWDDRRDTAGDPTFLGELAEKETAYLSREVLAAFPEKRGLYLRRLTEKTFSDVLVVNPALAPAMP